MTEQSKGSIKLAEALALRAAVQKEQKELERKIQDNLVFKEKEKPDENAAALVETYVDTSIQLRELIIAINATNIATPFGEGTITSAIAERDRLSSVKDMLSRSKTYLKPSSSTHYATSDKKPPVKDVFVFEAKDMAKEIRRIEKLNKELDMRLQLANWETPLILDEDSPAWKLISAARELENTSTLESVFDKRSGIRGLLLRKSPWG